MHAIRTPSAPATNQRRRSALRSDVASGVAVSAGGCVHGTIGLRGSVTDGIGSDDWRSCAAMVLLPWMNLLHEPSSLGNRFDRRLFRRRLDFGLGGLLAARFLLALVHRERVDGD